LFFVGRGFEGPIVVRLVDLTEEALRIVHRELAKVKRQVIERSVEVKGIVRYVQNSAVCSRR